MVWALGWKAREVLGRRRFFTAVAPFAAASESGGGPEGSCAGVSGRGAAPRVAVARLSFCSSCSSPPNDSPPVLTTFFLFFKADFVAGSLYLGSQYLCHEGAQLLTHRPSGVAVPL